MNIKELTQPKPSEPVSGAVERPVMLINISKQSALPTEWIKELETEVLAIADQITQVTNGDENDKAVAAQASLAKYIRAVQNAEEKAKKPLNELRGKILALSKQLISRADEAGNRLGKLVSEFAIAENNRVAAVRRLRDKEASDLERERDQRLATAQSVDEQDQIKDEFRELLANNAPPIEPLRANGQVIREEYEIEVFDVFLLVRAHPVCVKMTPLLSEIKTLLDAGVAVAGVRAKKVTKAGIRLGKEQEPISV